MKLDKKYLIIGEFGQERRIASQKDLIKNLEISFKDLGLTKNDIILISSNELENKTMINIKNGFLSYYNTKDGLPKIKVVVMEYTTDAEEQYKQEEREAIQNEGSYEEVFGGELPF